MSRLNLEDSILERPIIKGGLKYAVTRLPDAAATIDADMGPVIYMVPTAARILTLPVVTADMAGLTFIITAGAAFALTVNNSAGTLAATVAASSTATIVCVPGSTTGWILG